MTPEIMYVVTALATTIATLAGILWRLQAARVIQLEADNAALERENRRYFVLILGAAEKPGGMEDLRKELARMIREER